MVGDRRSGGVAAQPFEVRAPALGHAGLSVEREAVDVRTQPAEISLEPSVGVATKARDRSTGARAESDAALDGAGVACGEGRLILCEGVELVRIVEVAAVFAQFCCTSATNLLVV